MIPIAASCAAAFVLTALVERGAARPSAEAPSLGALGPRVLVFCLLYAFWLGIWWRPVLAGFAAWTTLAVMTAISWRKRQLIGEPLIFSDFGLIRLILRHPDLYYTGFMAKPPFLVAAALFVGFVAAWLALEPAAIGLAASLALLAAVAAAIALAWSAAARTPLAGLLRRRLPRPELERHVARWGLLLTLVAYALRWRGEIGEPFAAETPVPAIGAGPYDRVVVVQLESFLDPARIGLTAPALPGLAALRRRALLHGPLRVPSHGAFTMRSEMAVLTGFSAATFGFRGFDPYLTDKGEAPATIASRLARQGFATLFMHPFRPDFFGRSSVVPRLGFDRLLFEGDFAGAERFGPYVSDAAMAERILAEAASHADRPILVVAVTMENHGPWRPERFPDEPDPTRQYLTHIANADRAIATLLDGLDRLGGRTLLCVFGDHPPILPGVAVSPEPTTDYALAALGMGVAAPPVAAETLTADGLGRLLAAEALAGRVAGAA